MNKYKIHLKNQNSLSQRPEIKSHGFKLKDDDYVFYIRKTVVLTIPRENVIYIEKI